MGLSAAENAFLTTAHEISPELARTLRYTSGAQSVSALSEAALDPRYTGRILALFEPLLPELCARWVCSDDTYAVLSAFGRVLPFAHCLADHAEESLARIKKAGSCSIGVTLGSWGALDLSEEAAVEVLLGIFRLLTFDNSRFGKYVRVSDIQICLTHPSVTVRYLAVRITCLYLHATDATLQTLIEKYAGRRPIQGTWEGKIIDYRFLSLWEERRYRDLQKELKLARLSRQELSSRAPNSRNQVWAATISPFTVRIEDVLLLRSKISRFPDEQQPLTLTFTTRRNLKALAEGLLVSRPLIVVGPIGCGKSSLIKYVASRMQALSGMLVLHINEYTDPRILLGVFSVESASGAFAWHPGVLTTAVKEGRWVLIENIGHASDELLAVLRPLITKRELHLPGRAEVLRAAEGFRLIATIATHPDAGAGQCMESMEGKCLIEGSCWNIVGIDKLPRQDLIWMVGLKFPSLGPYAQQIISLYTLLGSFSLRYSVDSSVFDRRRGLTLRELIRFCKRVCEALSTSSVRSTIESELIYMEAVDCFTGALCESAAKDDFLSSIAEHLQLDPVKQSYLLRYRNIEYKNISTPSSELLHIGRVSLEKVPEVNLNFPKQDNNFSTNRQVLQLLEGVALAIKLREPVLLVGETGTGKTSCIQYLAKSLGHKLITINLSHQSELGDLVGGYRPLNLRAVMQSLQSDFEYIFSATFPPKKNARFKKTVSQSMAKGHWSRVIALWNEALRLVPGTPPRDSLADTHGNNEMRVKTKKRRMLDPSTTSLAVQWHEFEVKMRSIESKLQPNRQRLAFSFIEGSIVKSVRNGDWLLLDEINLASLEILEFISELLEDSSGQPPSLLLPETGSIERVQAHPGFRLFAAMNPATDVGKRELPMSVRSRFTELYVESLDRDAKVIQSIIESYLAGVSMDETLASDVTSLFLLIQRLAGENLLVNSADQKPYFSLRTLTRTLLYTQDMASCCGLRRALYEGFEMSFMTFLNKSSQSQLRPLMKKYIFGMNSDAEAELKKPILQPKGDCEYVKEGQYWIRRGRFDVEEQSHYIITPFVRQNLDNLMRASSSCRFPILLEGPTSSGKTSMVEFLAKRSGNRTVRINNHEHTDIQEYFGAYVSSDDGNFIFQDGLLVQALREGYWIILDELNLAPTEVLEALNRLLDDNREVMIPDTQELVRPSAGFMLFATQNPAGLYGGRKVLSRAFRSRFLELHFDDIPVGDLTQILQQRTRIPQSWSRRIVDVYMGLMQLRREDRLFERSSFATLRDLFRWAVREADSVERLATNGFMLLAERVRKPADKSSIKSVIETVLSRGGPRVFIDDSSLYSVGRCPYLRFLEGRHSVGPLVLTPAIRRLLALIISAIKHNEPVLLVGETGCGKTAVCHAVAESLKKDIIVLNAHQNTETGDIIGAQRPVRGQSATEKQLRHDLQLAITSATGADLSWDACSTERLLHVFKNIRKSDLIRISSETLLAIERNKAKLTTLFEWADGPLIRAMKHGQVFLLDEISLAEDSVLERLNSVLEPERTLVLAEKGPFDARVVARDGFQILATMNPGGEYGKRELSPALRNRFTEIWVPPICQLDEVEQVVLAKITSRAAQYSSALVQFAAWFTERYSHHLSSVSLRDILSWVSFVNEYQSEDVLPGIVHGAAMVYIDTLGANPAAMNPVALVDLKTERQTCTKELGRFLGIEISHVYEEKVELGLSGSHAWIGRFSFARPNSVNQDLNFTLRAPTATLNAMRIFRALQIRKPILLEGSPGVGKTSLIFAISTLVGKSLTRINLSEQTDLTDLFGSDVPAEGAQMGSFMWRDGPFLSAMKNGDWVLLDEMNLASQPVLEGLNACLDHRGEAYIAELDQKFYRHPEFRVFAAQNPHHQGSGRKGLPASFVNRFTVVFAEGYTSEDQRIICKEVCPEVPDAELMRIIGFVGAIERAVNHERSFGVTGGPWEFNLRDTLRWIKLAANRRLTLPSGTIRDFMDPLFKQRFRTGFDRDCVLGLFSETFGGSPEERDYYHNLSPISFQVGLGLLHRKQETVDAFIDVSSILRDDLPTLESIMICVRENWPVLLVSPDGLSNMRLLEQLAALSGANLVQVAMHGDTDVGDFIGGYEQHDQSRTCRHFLRSVSKYLRDKLVECLHSTDFHRGTTQAWQVLEIVEGCNDASGLHDLQQLGKLIGTLLSKETEDRARKLMHDYSAISQRLDQRRDASFEWVDGILIRALEEGSWLVLQQANLCSPSVLDRINSLLEPDGHLVISEHRTADGKARVVRPHPNFRIFLTMEPRHGELSRAMRNRAVELYHQPSQASQSASENKQVIQATTQESAMYRYRNILALEDFECENRTWNSLVDTTLDHLSLSDLDRAEEFSSQLDLGLVNVSQSSPTFKLHERFNILSQFEKSWSWKKAAESWSLQALSSTAREWGIEQTVHPLNNKALVHSHAAGVGAYWLARMYDFCFETTIMQRALCKAKEQPNSPKPASELIGGCFASVRGPCNEDFKVHWESFLVNLHYNLSAWAQQSLQKGFADKENLESMEHLQMYWWMLFNLLETEEIAPATCQAVYLVGEKICMSLKRRGHDLLQPANQLEEDLRTFSLMGELESGWSMERLWRPFKYNVPTSFEQLGSLIHLEALADRFDAMVYRCKVPLIEIVDARDSLKNALKIAAKGASNAKALLADAGHIVSIMENSISGRDEAVLPYFVSEFSALNHYMDLKAVVRASQGGSRIGYSNSVAEVLGCRATKSFLPTCNPSSNLPLCLAALFYYIRNEGPQLNTTTGEDELITSILHKATRMKRLDLARLSSLRFELDCLLRTLISEPYDSLSDRIDTLDSLLEVLVMEVCLAHSAVSRTEDYSPLGPGFAKTYLTKLYHSGVSPNQDFDAFCGDQFPRIYEQYLAKSLKYLVTSFSDRAKKVEAASMAWINYSVGCILLFVPDRQTDPFMNSMLEARSASEAKFRLESMLLAQKHFGLHFQGQESTSRSRFTQQLLQDFSPTSYERNVARPPSNEMAQLQEEFNNVLHTVRKVSSALLCTDLDLLRGATLRENTVQLIERLSTKYRAYDDITAPAVGFLSCLYTGFLLASSLRPLTSLNGLLFHLSDQTIFLGTHPRTWLALNVHAPLLHTECSPGIQLHALRNLSIYRTLGISTVPSAAIEELVHNLFFAFFERWKCERSASEGKMGAQPPLHNSRTPEREAEATCYSNNSYSTDVTNFRNSPHKGIGSEAFALRGRALYQELADIHYAIFVHGEEAPVMIGSLLKDSTKLLGLIPDQLTEVLQASVESVLPGLIFYLNEEATALRNDNNEELQYDFYADSNFTEIEILLNWMLQVQSRFLNLSYRWPEHAAPAEVLQICKEILGTKIEEPLAAFALKCEHLKGSLIKWSTAANTEHLIAEIHEELTDLIVRWRKLEIQTWKRALECETDHFGNQEKSWWYVAFEMIIATPETLEAFEDKVRHYLQDLVRDLWNILSSTSAGHFSQRIRTLTQISRHAERRATVKKIFKRISAVVNSLLTFLRRLEPQVIQYLLEKRKALQAEMDCLVSSASLKKNLHGNFDAWKILQRRELGLINQYRALLEQPVMFSMIPDLPGPVSLQSRSDRFEYRSLVHFTEEENDGLMSLLEASAHEWSLRPQRYRTFADTVTFMVETVRERALSNSKLNKLESFTYLIKSSVVELVQTVDTKTLGENEGNQGNEGNEGNTKHTKNLKRRLLADILREIKFSGLPVDTHNSILKSQWKIGDILGSIPTLPKHDGLDLKEFCTSENLLHGVITMFPTIAEVLHLEPVDLAKQSIIRAADSVESFFQSALKQGRILAEAVIYLQKFEEYVNQALVLCAPAEYAVRKGTLETITDLAALKQSAAALPALIKVSVKIISAFERPSNSDLSALTKFLEESAEKFENLSAEACRLPLMPDGILTSAHDDTLKVLKLVVCEFKLELKDWIARNPVVKTVLEQLVPWTELPVAFHDTECAPRSSLSIQEWSEKLLSTLDLALEPFQTVRNAPASEAPSEGRGWFLRLENDLLNFLAALCSEPIISSMELLLNCVKDLADSDSDAITVSAARFAIAAPFFKQYAYIMHHLISQVAALYSGTCEISYYLASALHHLMTKTGSNEAASGGVNAKDTGDLIPGEGFGDGEGSKVFDDDVVDFQLESEGDKIIEGTEGNRGLDEQITNSEGINELGSVSSDVDSFMNAVEGQEAPEQNTSTEKRASRADQERRTNADAFPDASEDDQSTMFEQQPAQGDKGEEANDQTLPHADLVSAKGDSTQFDTQTREDDLSHRDNSPSSEEDEASLTNHRYPEEDLATQADRERCSPKSLDWERVRDSQLSSDLESFHDLESEPAKDEGIPCDADDERLSSRSEYRSENDTRSLLEGIGEDIGTSDFANDTTQEQGHFPVASATIPPSLGGQRASNHMLGVMLGSSQGFTMMAPSEGIENQPQKPSIVSTLIEASHYRSGVEQERSVEETLNSSEAGSEAESEPAKLKENARVQNDLNQDSDIGNFKNLRNVLDQWQAQQVENDISERQNNSKTDNTGLKASRAAFDSDEVFDSRGMTESGPIPGSDLHRSTRTDEGKPVGSVSEQDKVTEELQGSERFEKKNKSRILMPNSTGVVDRSRKRRKSFSSGGHSSPSQHQDEPRDERSAIDRTKVADGEHANLITYATRSRGLDDAYALWTRHESLTSALSKILAEQLRLILEPTVKTKLRGDFRTGKRLNMKRIIPYIASQYKRDKIWMRRTVPTKRAFQILMALDDSKSMSENGSVPLALDTLALVAQALAYLEVGELCVVSFGEDVSIAHAFGDPFSSHAGTELLRHFCFHQAKTDVCKLVRKSIQLLRNARARASGSQTDLWQLMLIISDGVCESHSAIQRLVRQAQEERIMMVFIIVDAAAGPNSGNEPGKSIFQLETAEFLFDQQGELKLDRRSYLDSFPFRWYLVVQDVGQLPSVMATALKQWFAEVANSNP